MNNHDFTRLIEQHINNKVYSIENVKFDEKEKTYEIEYTTQLGYKSNKIKIKESGDFLEDEYTTKKFKYRFFITDGRIIEIKLYKGNSDVSYIKDPDSTLMYKINRSIDKHRSISSRPGLAYLIDDEYFEFVDYVICLDVFKHESGGIVSEFEVSGNIPGDLDEERFKKYLEDFLLDTSSSSWSKKFSKKYLISNTYFKSGDNLETSRIFFEFVTPESKCIEV